MPTITHSFLAFLLSLVVGATAAGSTVASQRERVSATGAYTRNDTTQRSTSLAIVTRYFAALDNLGRPAHDYQTLNRLYDPGITLVESLITGRPRVHTGLQQARAFDQGNVLIWNVERTEQLSPSDVLAIERPGVKGPGHELSHAGPWLTMFTLKNGKIVALVWMPCCG